MSARAPRESRGRTPARTFARRLRALAAIGVIASTFGACTREDSRSSTPAGSDAVRASATSAGELAADDRVAHLLAPCAKNEAFLDDTSDMIPVLVSKLAAGQLEPQKRAKEELADLGATALPELARVLEENFKRHDGSQRVQNVLSVVTLMDVNDGRELLLRGLEHPQESVRIAAVHGLAKHGKSEDYDRLRALLPIASAELQDALGGALFRSDRARFELDALDWMSQNTYLPVWRGELEQLADSDHPATVERARQHITTADLATAPCLHAILARAGDAASLAALRAELAADTVPRRTIAIQALDRAGLVSEYAQLLKTDPAPKVRLTVATLLAARPFQSDTHAVLVQGSADASRDVRQVCLTARIAARDESAIQQALELLKGDRLDLEMGLGVLRSAWLADPAQAERGLAILQGLWSGEILPQRVDRNALARAIGQVPIEKAARALYDLANSTPGKIQNLPAHRWYLVHAGNTGLVGRAFLRSRWSEERDPERRMDIVTASSYDHTDDERIFLARVIEDRSTTPLEVLHAADVLANLGPSGYSAPILKRAALGIDDARVRPAMNCLLWRWFGRDT